MVKALQIKDFPNYYITDNGDVYSRYTNNKHNNLEESKKSSQILVEINTLEPIYIKVQKNTKNTFTDWLQTHLFKIQTTNLMLIIKTE